MCSKFIPSESVMRIMNVFQVLAMTEAVTRNIFTYVILENYHPRYIHSTMVHGFRYRLYKHGFKPFSNWLARFKVELGIYTVVSWLNRLKHYRCWELRFFLSSL